MMKDDDLKTFLSLLESAKHEIECGPYEPASRVLQKSDGLFSSEIWRLSRSLQIGAAAGDFSTQAAQVADHIWNDLGEKRSAPLSEKDAWKKAIRWALFEGDSPFRSGNTNARQTQVGKAYASLRKQGFSLKLTAYGLEIDGASQKEIFRKAESLTSLLGGLEILKQICEYMHHNNKIHDGMWMLGDQVPGVMQTKVASVPLSWLFSLAMKYLYKPNTARKPAIAWKTLVSLVTDVAATLDCERYNQFEGIDMHPSQFWRSMLDSLFWREFFTLPQVPTNALGDILCTLVSLVEKEGETTLASELSVFVQEVLALSGSLRPDGLALIRREHAFKSFPKLMITALGRAGKVNSEMTDLFASSKRDHERFLLFEEHKRDIIILPAPLFNAAACELSFITVWEKMPSSKAAKIVGATMEAVLAKSCKGKAPTLEVSRKYKAADGKNVEIDVAAREADEIVLIETKAKSLTAQSRESGGFSYISDYTKSYLSMIKQLMVHERSIRNGVSPLIKQAEKFDDFRPLKIAVSPLSYGQLSDKIFASSVIRGLFNANLTPVPGRDSEENVKIINDFNKGLSEARVLIGELAPQRDGLAEIAPYLIDFFWVDLGQAVYVLKRAVSVARAFKPLKHITYSTRDFWTEVAIADRGSMTNGHWTAVSPTPAASP